MSESRESRLVGLIGYPLRHSISPAFQQAAFDALRINARYELWETPPDQLAGLAARLRADACLGANVTIPFKQAIIDVLDGIDESAAMVGAVNTIVHDRTGLRGFNTDVVGFVEALRVDGHFAILNHRAVVLGAGGAARAVVAALLTGGAAEVTLAARRPEQARSLLADLHRDGTGAITRVMSLEDADEELRDSLGEADLLVNATPIGTAHRADESRPPLDPSLLHDRLFVCDLVYNPPETTLLRAARDRGSRTLNGLPMLIYQGAAAFELWTRQAAPIALMRAKAMEALGV